jgi:hypothetical protein
MKILAASMLICVLCACAGNAQDIGSITGLVTDSSHAPIVGATVSITNRETNVGAKAVTGSTGLYVATSLRVGIYEIAVEVSAVGHAEPSLRQGGFGSITSVVNSSRDIQMGLKFIW